jgi:hypothetical protein
MSRLEGIEQAIERLAPEEFAQIVRRVTDLDNSRWENQLDCDAQSGKLDFAFSGARRATKSLHGPSRQPPSSSRV